jgi:hypothetical protein
MESQGIPGTTGAFRSTWRKGNPRSLLQAIINKNPKADEPRIHELFWREVEDDKELLRSCVEYWCDHNYRSLIQSISTPAEIEKTARARAERAQTEASKIRARVVVEAKQLFFDWLMPNNKKLADCTGTECRQFGGWLSKVAKKVPAKSLVREVLTEQQLRKIWSAA